MTATMRVAEYRRLMGLDEPLEATFQASVIEPTEPQTAWLAALDQAQRVSAHVWRQADWTDIELALR